MADVRWTPQAAGDFEQIADFIAQDSLHYASLFVMKVLEDSDLRLTSISKSIIE